MTSIDQSDIGTLLQEAAALASAASAELGEASGAGPAEPTKALPDQDDISLARILKVRVPVIAQLARRPMSVAIIRDLSVGAILEFEKSVDEELDLLISDRLIGQGHCVKVGEKFGLRITHICDKAERIRSLGGP